MPLVTEIIRMRRNARKGSTAGTVGVAPALLVVLVLVVGAMIMAIAFVFADLTADLRPIQGIERAFGQIGSESFQPVRLYDRSGEILFFEVVHPDASARLWISLDPISVDALPFYATQAMVAALDVTYWTNPGYVPEALLQDLAGSILARPNGMSEPTIAQLLVEDQLIPLETVHHSQLARNFRSALLAAELTRRYSKEQILEWYLNSAYFGNFVYGIDAAALVYFGKHATALTLAESAMLGTIASQPEMNPADTPREAREHQVGVLRTMLDLGMISSTQYEAALSQTVKVREADVKLTSHVSEFAKYTLARLDEILGPSASRRSGLRVVTTLDNDLQLQAGCAAQTHAHRLGGGEVGGVMPAIDGSACVAAGLLPTLRPSDAGVDHKITDVAVVILDPTMGEILSMLGPADLLRPMGSAFMPFIYLTAFSQGYSPGTMVLDIPSSQTMMDEELGAGQNSEAVYHGPVRMRTALANSYEAAAVRSLNLVGVESVLRDARLMGINLLEGTETDPSSSVAAGNVQATLLDAALAYSVIANQGQMEGVEVPSDRLRPGFRSLDPVSILQVEDIGGRLVYSLDREARTVLSSQLAFLMVDVLSDETARWPAFGRPNALEVGRPAGALTGITTEGMDNWTIGFTPSRAVGVWVGNLEGEDMQGVHMLNGATPIWQAVLRYTTRDLPAEGWSTPPGVSTVEVCDPSGLLPSQYCPNVVREVFINGTEPTHIDNLYRPFQINKETGKLATLYTPLEDVEERVYMIPPPGASEWAAVAGIEQPPKEYDTFFDQASFNPDVNISAPAPFHTVRGTVTVKGWANSDDFASYRLQYGQGLNPARWVQIGQDVHAPVSDGQLGKWDTQGLNGLYTLQLVVVRDDGQIAIASVQVTIDNQPPSIKLHSPEPDQTFKLGQDREVIIAVEVLDDVSLEKVIFYIDQRQIITITEQPYSTRWGLRQAGEYEVFARAYDVAGNMAESEPVVIKVTR
jgi:membrane carboxypeptidase/penicillin-binding protein